MRSLLFVPGDSERKMEKGLASGADVLLLDLEDSVSLPNKEAARALTACLLRTAAKDGPRLFVRVNDLRSGFTDADLAAVMPAAPAGIMLPKAVGLRDVEQLATKLRVHEAEHGLEDGGTQILPIITETPAAVLAAIGWSGRHARMVGLTWGAEDLSAEIGVERTRTEDGALTDVFRLARAVTVLAAAASEVAAIDTVFVDFRDDAALRRECENAARDGFTGKMAIHPGQVAAINEAFTPSAEALAHARSVVDAFAAAGNPGVVGIDGKMFDRPHLKRAQRLLGRVAPTG
ncbi:HpcH/HpaI aldolase/citrate lyase family protein [Tianweitania sediminis]|uniref:CoA ester lyase n=1 Tax=Tianweitania sediminis TaxID=1502156 RepID=A0A8J7UJC0_9HYPH|nr:CoA ester lyase [Tianweitania sediminis]MBP0439863.1 CoA ester lyase [Tianweitania sediminis]